MKAKLDINNQNIDFEEMDNIDLELALNQFNEETDSKINFGNKKTGFCDLLEEVNGIKKEINSWIKIQL
ncbi:MAG: hypothetical protein ACOC1O_02360 [bacterium]